jgi:hypothetical protein
MLFNGQGKKTMNSHGTAGRTAHKMAEDRYKKVAIYAALLFLISIMWFFNFSYIIKLGLPTIVVLAVAILMVAKRIEKKGLYVKKRAKDADRGAHAEEVVAERLLDLPDGYHVFHDIAFDGFNVDHIIVGPGGIFLVETKSHSGNVDARGDTLLLNGTQPPKNFLNQTWSQTYQLKDFLKKQTSREWAVKPVLCFTRAFVKVRQPVKRIAVVNKGYLNKYLLQQQQNLNTEDIETIARILHISISKQDKPAA